jgi:hypothetical protein
MVKIEYLNKLQELGLLNDGLKLGVIPCSTKRNLNIYKEFLFFISESVKKTEIYFILSQKHKLSEMQIQRIIKDLENV